MPFFFEIFINKLNIKDSYLISNVSYKILMDRTGYFIKLFELKLSFDVQPIPTVSKNADLI